MIDIGLRDVHGFGHRLENGTILQRPNENGLALFPFSTRYKSRQDGTDPWDLEDILDQILEWLLPLFL
jgi:hypothetical protein